MLRTPDNFTILHTFLSAEREVRVHGGAIEGSLEDLCHQLFI